MLTAHDRVYVTAPFRRGTGTVLEVRRDHTVRVCLDAGRVVRVSLDDVRQLDRDPPAAGELTSAPDYSAAEVSPAPKRKPLRSPSWLKWVRQRACEWCRAAGPSEASHHNAEGHGATASKADDCDTLPLCSRCHAEYHRAFRLGSMDARQTREWVQTRINATHKDWLREHVWGECG